MGKKGWGIVVEGLRVAVMRLEVLEPCMDLGVTWV